MSSASPRLGSTRRDSSMGGRNAVASSSRRDRRCCQRLGPQVMAPEGRQVEDDQPQTPLEGPATAQQLHRAVEVTREQLAVEDRAVPHHGYPLGEGLQCGTQLPADQPGRAQESPSALDLEPVALDGDERPDAVDLGLDGIAVRVADRCSEGADAVRCDELGSDHREHAPIVPSDPPTEHPWMTSSAHGIDPRRMSSQEGAVKMAAIANLPVGWLFEEPRRERDDLVLRVTGPDGDENLRRQGRRRRPHGVRWRMSSRPTAAAGCCRWRRRQGVSVPSVRGPSAPTSSSFGRQPGRTDRAYDRSRVGRCTEADKSELIRPSSTNRPDEPISLAPGPDDPRTIVERYEQGSVADNEELFAGRAGEGPSGLHRRRRPHGGPGPGGHLPGREYLMSHPSPSATSDSTAWRGMDGQQTARPST